MTQKETDRVRVRRYLLIVADKKKTGETFLAYYRTFFGDARFRFVDIEPCDPEEDHVGLEEKIRDPAMAAQLDTYVHPCWCNPELIYADDDRCNEVWLHKRIQ